MPSKSVRCTASVRIVLVRGAGESRVEAAEEMSGCPYRYLLSSVESAESTGVVSTVAD